MTDMFDEFGSDSASVHRLFERGTKIKKEHFIVQNGKDTEDYAIINISEFENEIDVDEVIDEVASEISRLVKIKKGMNILVVALGNRYISADALGAKTLNYVIPTRNGYLRQAKTNVMTIATNVFALSGVEAFDIVKAMTKSMDIDLVVVIDSLCAKSYHRLGKSFQLNNAGIFPGLGLGNERKKLSTNSLNVPVLVMGVPLVMFARDMCENVEDDFVVTLKDIETVVKRTARILGYAINKAVLGLSARESEEILRQI